MIPNTTRLFCFVATVALAIATPGLATEKVGLISSAVPSLVDTTGCIRSLNSALQIAGFAAEAYDAVRAGNDEAYRSSFTYEVILVSGSDLRRVIPTDPTGYVLAEGSVFSGPIAVADFLSSPTLASLMAISGCPNCDPFNPQAAKIVAVAYMGSAQIFTADRPLAKPGDLAGRVGIGTRAAASLLGHADFEKSQNRPLRRDDGLIENAQQTLPGLRKALQDMLSIYQPEEYFVLMPVAVAAEVMPPRARAYMTTTMAEILSVAFLVNATERGEGYEMLAAAVQAAADECSRDAFEKEVSAVKNLISGGTRIAKADNPAFKAETIAFLEDQLKPKPGVKADPAILQAIRQALDIIRTKVH